METCNCYWCKNDRKLQKSKDAKDVQMLYRLAQQYANKAKAASSELNYYESIFRGDWPSAVEILEAKLKQLKEKESK